MRHAPPDEAEMPLRLPHLSSYPAIASQVLILGRNELAVNVKDETALD
jgi:hypothetical protein